MPPESPSGCAGICKSDKIDGVSLFSPQNERIIAIEDHSLFTPTIGCYHDLWGARSPDHFYIESLSESVLLEQVKVNHYKIVKKPENKTILKYKAILEAHTCSYSEKMKERDILSFYNQMKSEISFYSDGTRRGAKKLYPLTSVFRAILRTIKYIIPYGLWLTMTKIYKLVKR